MAPILYCSLVALPLATDTPAATTHCNNRTVPKAEGHCQGRSRAPSTAECPVVRAVAGDSQLLRQSELIRTQRIFYECDSHHLGEPFPNRCLHFQTIGQSTHRLTQ